MSYAAQSTSGASSISIVCARERLSPILDLVVGQPSTGTVEETGDSMLMKLMRMTIVVALGATLATSTLHAGVNVSTNEPTENAVAFRVLDSKYIGTAPSNSLDCTAMKIGGKQRFTIVDLNGGQLADGHEVRIQYVPTSDGKPDPDKASYWREVKEGVKRGHDGDVFKIKRVSTKCTLQTVSGKFVAAPVEGGLLGVTNAPEAAMLVELVDLSSVKLGAKIPKDLPTLAVAAPSDAKPAATGQSAPVPQPTPTSP
jgi:hypothetical protein